MFQVELIRVEKRWGDTVALQGIDLQIPSGSFCVLLGPSGCGKSTTLRIIAGLEQASAGAVRIAGRDVTGLSPSERGIAMVFQNYALFPHLTVADNIAFGLQVRRVPKAEAAMRLEDAATLLGLVPLLRRKPSQLSGGQQQRVALARALVSRARVCLMDEPLSNLDAQLRQDMRRELRELQQKLALTVVYVTHDQAEAMSMADQVVLMQHGQIAQNAPPRELYARPSCTFAGRFIGTPAMNLLRLDADRIAGTGIRLPVAPGAATFGVRPEAVRIVGVADAAAGGELAVDARVRSEEYLGADLVLRCAVGDEVLTVRAAGDRRAAVGDPVRLAWPRDASHCFDAAGRRLPMPGDIGPPGAPACRPAAGHSSATDRGVPPP